MAYFLNKVPLANVHVMY